VQRALKVINKSPPALVAATATTPSNQDEVDAWEELEGIARGTIILSLHPTIAEAIDTTKSVPDIWAAIKNKYGKPGPSGIYLEFKKLLGTEIPNNADPSLALDAMSTSIGKMKALGCEVLHKIQVLMYMSKLGSGFDMVTQRLNLAENLTKVGIPEVEKSIWLTWEQRASKKNPPQATKISTVKCAPGEQQFSKQQETQDEGSQRKQTRRAGKARQPAEREAN
jgi:hypothetical protein